MSETIGDRIRKLRELNRMTLEDVAKQLSISRATVFKYENNIISNIPPEKVEALARCFNISPGYIMGWEDDYERVARESAVPQNGEEVPKVAVFFKDYMDGKSPEFQEMVLRFLQAADGESFARAMKEENIKDLEDMINGNTRL